MRKHSVVFFKAFSKKKKGVGGPYRTPYSDDICSLFLRRYLANPLVRKLVAGHCLICDHARQRYNENIKLFNLRFQHFHTLLESDKWTAEVVVVVVVVVPEACEIFISFYFFQVFFCQLPCSNGACYNTTK